MTQGVHGVVKMAAMDLENLHNRFANSPTVRLLRSQQAAFVLYFLNRAFKGAEAPEQGSLAHEELRRRLVVFQEDLRDDGYEALAQAADHYLVAWSDEAWLRRFLKSDSNQPHYQLTRHTEDALRFVDALMTRESRLVGTEGRLRLVIDTLTDIVRGATDNPDRRLKDLQAQRDAIDREIESIRAGGAVETYPEATIRDRFQTAIELLRTLQGDFRAVEDRFEQIAREVHTQTQRRRQSRGSILAGALDAEDLIRQEDEGVSFYAFVAFLFSPTRQEELRAVIDELVQLPALSKDRDGVHRVRQLLPSLLNEADNVLRQTGRLSETLRRLLDADSIDHRRRVAEVLREIRTTAATLSAEHPAGDDADPRKRIGLDVEAMPTLRSAFSRSFWNAPQPLDVTPVDEAVDLTQTTREALKLAALKNLPWRSMRTTLADMMDASAMVTLPEVLTRMPPRAGVIEVVGWLQIAHEDGHEIDESLTERVLIEDRPDESGPDEPGPDGEGPDGERRPGGEAAGQIPKRVEVMVPMIRFMRDRTVRPATRWRRPR
ncbi:DUF3375 family protein [Roseimaritima sediminicola]|uniref:DUF3375 family protein n=1 Tax=Roseimaritima sediminicola TaxID=2662066 RepID=UPI0012983763|nr:DUF3375 family protein [Roseimaritima sediminicola]